ncbi:hypothetical protein OIF94_11815, partial [Neisseria meningitidis]|nr:hypothetical protein [Neisseria meningitidis]MCV6711163.1 hypothetical protein [Neisseria meningitidis]
EQENITFTADIKKPLSLGCQRGMLRKVMRPFDRAHHIRRESSLVGTETYRENGFFRFCVLDSHFRGNDGI